MKTFTLLKPVNRLVYFYGVIFITLVPKIFGFYAVKGLGDVSKITSALFFISLFFGIVKIIWDYKRVIDISSNKLYLLLLVIPFLSIIESVFLSKWGSISLQYSISELKTNNSFLFMMIGIIGMVNFFYQLFLLFKKGDLGAK